MDKEKFKLILEAMQGITNTQWKKLSTCIDKSFSIKADEQSKHMTIASPEEILEILYWES